MNHAASPVAVRHVKTDKVPELATATWSNCLVVGDEIVMSGMTAHPASRQQTLDTYQQTLVVLGKIRDLVEAAGGNVGSITMLVIYVTDIAHKEEVGRARRDFFGRYWERKVLATPETGGVGARD